ncbi:MAG: sigma-70 family RNA polymerase sigma factor [Planctomycetota bacterium]
MAGGSAPFGTSTEVVSCDTPAPDVDPASTDEGSQLLMKSDLAERCRRGDREAQRELYTRTSERIHRLLVRMTGNPDAAFDLAQDTYLRAFERIHQFDGRASLETWLYRIAVTEALQFLRQARRDRVHLQARNTEGAVESTSNGSIARLDVNDALAALDPDERAILLLRYQEGLDYRAIASVVDCAEGTVASRLHRARERLRKYLGASYAPGEESKADGHPKDGDTGSAEARSKAGGPSGRGTDRK